MFAINHSHIKKIGCIFAGYLVCGVLTLPTYRIYLSPPVQTGNESAAILEVLQSNWIAPAGPALAAFEEGLCQVTGAFAALAVNSGTAALHLALRLMGVGPGVKVICPTLTFVATVNPVRYLGAEPIFVDCADQSYNIDPVALAQALETVPPATPVILTHLYGDPVDFSTIQSICVAKRAPIIEDAAEALGARYGQRACGSLAPLAALSFNGNKVITTGGGGALLCANTGFRNRALVLATQARQPVAWYEHHELGYNYRLSNVLAAIGLAQLPSLSAFVARKRAIRARYRTAFDGHPKITMLPEPEPPAYSSAWLSVIHLPTPLLRDRVMNALNNAGIESRPVWKPMHQQPLFAGCRFFGGNNAEHLFQTGLCLPSGAGLTDNEQIEVINTIFKALE